jgi:two-component system, NtrC family, nitrogen regulation sensor histidine kinase NtrY
MFKTIKNFNWIIGSSVLCLFVGILTFLTFINRSFITLTDSNLQILIIVDFFLLIIFFLLIFQNLKRIYSADKRRKKGSQTNFKYVSLFSLFTFIPSLLVAIFSLFIFNFGVQNFFNEQIKKAVNNSYDLAKSYSIENKNTIKTDIFLMSVGVNRASSLFYSNINRFKNIIRSEKILRRVDDVYLIDSSGNIMFSDLRNTNNQFIIPDEDIFDQALEGLPVLISNSQENKNSVIMKINNLIDTYLYISRNVDPEIILYLNETEEAVNFYYSIENSRTGIKITFAVIYIIVVTLLLFLSTSIAITFAQRLTRPIINLITASDNISKGILNTKVPDIEADEEFKMLNKNFNNMIGRLKSQQDKLLIAEKYSAWENVARKLAHEIKNPLTPIQLSIDRLKEKFASQMKDSNDFKNYLDTINRQIKDIENLANEFSNFARMPNPKFEIITINSVLNRAIDFIKMSSENLIIFEDLNKNLYVNADEEQLYRVFINLIKNSEESFLEKKVKTLDFKGKIHIEILSINDYIVVKIEDNGLGIVDIKKVMTPYFTTKKTGTGLGLPIVEKIINEHSGELYISNIKSGGTEVKIFFPKINEK